MVDLEATSQVNLESIHVDTDNRIRLTFRSTIWWQLFLVLLIILPYLFAWWQTPEGMIFTGALFNPDDMGVYVSAMRQRVNT